MHCLAPSFGGIIMAEIKTKSDERVDLFVPRGNDDDPNLVIGVNGVLCVLPRGKTSKVLQYIADEYYRSQAAQGTMDAHMDAFIKKASKPLAE